MANRLPADYAIDALSAEAWARHMSYGQLMASTTREDREQIQADYMRHHRKKRRTKYHQVDWEAGWYEE